MRLFSLCVSLLSLSFGLVSCDPLSDAYTAFNSSTAAAKVGLAQTMLTLTTYTAQNRPSLGWSTNVLGFAENVNAIQKVSFINLVNKDKPVHRYGTAATVEFTTLSGTAPSSLFLSPYGVIRFSSGQPTKVIGVGVAVFGDNEQIQTRVFSSDKSQKYNIPVPQQTFDVTAQGPEGRLAFVPAAILNNIDISDNKNHDYRTDFEALPVGTIVGTITGASDYSGTPFSVQVKITSKLVSAQASDQNWWFRRTLKSYTPFGGLFLAALETIGFGTGLFDGSIAHFFETEVDTSTLGCPMIQQPTPNMMNDATIAAIVVASIAIVMAIASTSMLVIKSRQQQTKQVAAIPL